MNREEIKVALTLLSLTCGVQKHQVQHKCPQATGFRRFAPVSSKIIVSFGDILERFPDPLCAK